MNYSVAIETLKQYSITKNTFKHRPTMATLPHCRLVVSVAESPKFLGEIY